MTFANSGYLLLLLLTVPYIVWYFMARRKEPTMKVSDTQAYQYIRPSLRQYLLHVPFFLRLLCFVMVVLVLGQCCCRCGCFCWAEASSGPAPTVFANILIIMGLRIYCDAGPLLFPTPCHDIHS